MSIPKIIDEIIAGSPFLEEALTDGLINISSLARKIKPEVETRLKEEVKEGAIVMAINRRPQGYYLKISRGIKSFMHQLGDIIVRSDLRDYTYANSTSLIACHRRLMEQIDREKDLFCTFSQGVYESTIIVSQSMDEKVMKIYEKEKLITKKTGLTSMTIRLPEDNTEISGVYYYILKNLAWAGVNIHEVISTTNEFTIVVTDNFVNQAFAILMSLKRNK
jgi:hypothetical protein